MAKIKIEELKKDLERYVDYDIDLSLINDYDQGYIQDIVNEIGDNQVSTYTSDLLDWANDSEHVEAIDNAMSEWGTPNDFIEIIRQGQCYYYMNIYNENIEELTKYYYLTIFEKREVEEIEEDLLEEVNFREFDTLEEVEEKALEDMQVINGQKIIESVNDIYPNNASDIRTFIEYNLSKNNNDLLINFYEELTNKISCNKMCDFELLAYWINSGLYMIGKLDFYMILEQVYNDMKEDQEIKKHLEDLDNQFKKIEEERKNQNIEFLGE